jgi:dethiobiotin synthetase
MRNPSKGVFITGTDTGVGKTFIACAIAFKYADGGAKVGVMKPVETGCTGAPGALMPADALSLKRYAGSPDPMDLINPYRFAQALAPNVAARLSGGEINLDCIRTSFDKIRADKDIVIVEGAGGLLSPLTDDGTMADLAVMLGLPLIIVAASRLGAINHALLTVRCAASMGLEILGVILSRPSPIPAESSLYDAAEIKRFAGAPVLADIPHLKDPGEARRLLPSGII